MAIWNSCLDKSRYGPALSNMSKADPAIYGGENLDSILAQWGKPKPADRISAHMRWRDRRLAALRAHSRTQPAG
jgi:hypothetical protein